ncbi:MAG: hypothetical protein QOJ16_212 [Acidobacteriota bacterium]|jgi:hypothetical protein|nr:hypothetical protein [Acidobacteriota bacterium]
MPRTGWTLASPSTAADGRISGSRAAKAAGVAEIAEIAEVAEIAAIAGAAGITGTVGIAEIAGTAEVVGSGWSAVCARCRKSGRGEPMGEPSAERWTSGRPSSRTGGAGTLGPGGSGRGVPPPWEGGGWGRGEVRRGASRWTTA